MKTMQKNGIVAAGDAATAKAGRAILDQGGNAIDAAVAASIAACVAEPMLTSLASGGYLLIHKDGQNVLIDGMCVMPKTTLEQPEKIVVDFGGAKQPFYIGRGSVAPPGQLAALIHAHHAYGSLPWNDIVTPAIRLAREGVNLSPFQAYVLELLRDVVRFTPEAEKIYAPNGELLKTGALFRNEAFADFLERLVQKPSAEILRGPYEKAGIPFELLEAREREPLKITFREYEVLTNPLPSPSGILIAYTLKALERHWPDSIEGRLTSLVTAFRNADWVRKEKVDGHWSDTTLTQRILGPSTSPFDATQGKPGAGPSTSLGAGPSTSFRAGNTTHISVIDKDGNAVSTTSSNGEGAGIMLGNTGIMPNNFLGETDLNPAGFFAHPAGMVLPSMMSPTFLLKDNDIAGALGSAGSERIRSAIVQVILSLLDGMAPQDAISAPRVHWDGSTVQVEPVDQHIFEALKKATTLPLNLWNEQNLYFGGVQLVTPSGGGADPRRGGAVA